VEFRRHFRFISLASAFVVGINCDLKKLATRRARARVTFARGEAGEKLVWLRVARCSDFASSIFSGPVQPAAGGSFCSLRLAGSF
jgi:hypothetical protein